MTSKGQAAFNLGHKRVTMPGRNGDPTLSIQRERTASLEQIFSPLYCTKTYFSPLYGKEWNWSSASLQLFQLQQALSAVVLGADFEIRSEIKKLAASLQVLCYTTSRDKPVALAFADMGEESKMIKV
jgi:hypothetical protein